jgi:hypothetical protein
MQHTVDSDDIDMTNTTVDDLTVNAFFKSMAESESKADKKLLDCVLFHPFYFQGIRFGWVMSCLWGCFIYGLGQFRVACKINE